MHDINDLDQRGISGGLVATVEFQDAARVQADALGFDPAIVWVPHPVQNQTTQELHQFADDAFTNILQLISKSMVSR